MFGFWNQVVSAKASRYHHQSYNNQLITILNLTSLDLVCWDRFCQLGASGGIFSIVWIFGTLLLLLTYWPIDIPACIGSSLECFGQWQYDYMASWASEQKIGIE